jgi:hypothetical protein
MAPPTIYVVWPTSNGVQLLIYARTDEKPSTRIDESWPRGTRECAEELERLGVPLWASTREAAVALRKQGHGRRHQIVVAAQRWRRRYAGRIAVRTALARTP